METTQVVEINVFDKLNEMIVFLAEDLSIRWLNQSARAFFHYPKDAITSVNYIDFCRTNNQTYPGFLNDHINVIDLELDRKIEKVIHNSMVIEWELISFPKDKNFSMMLIGRDKTDYEKISTSKQDIELRIKSIINALPGNYWWKDLSGRYLGCNENVSRTLQLPAPDYVIGKTDYELPWSKYADHLVKHDNEVITGEKTITKEENILALSGELLTFLVVKTPLYNSVKKMIGTIGVSFDVTELKKAQKELEKSKSKAELASRSKSEFIANMSHDIRTPITGMLGLVQDMINTADKARASLQQQKPLKNISANRDALLNDIVTKVQSDGDLLVGATDELLQLCNEILEVVCLETGKPSQQVESFNFHELVKHNIELLQPTAQHKKLNLFYEIADNVPTFLKGLCIYLDRSLLNLISNALKFTEKGFVKVTASLLDANMKTPQVGDTITLKLTVDDSGMGIPKDKFDTIFEHFSRLTSSYQGVYKGAGLGLYTVKRYIEAMKGQITLDSEVDKGTRFTLTLPFIVSDHADRKKESIRPPKPTPTLGIKAAKTELSEVPTEKAAATVLLVEDSVLAARAAKASLKSFGCAIDVAETGKQAVSMAQRNKYNLILMDIGLPDFTGGEATQKIRALSDPEKANVPIVALTGHAGNPDKRQEALDAGMQDVLNKPVQPLALELILNSYVFKKSNAQKAKPITTDKTTCDVTVLDWDACVRMMQGDAAMARELLSLLASELKETAPLLAKDYANKNTTVLRDTLHRLCGGVCYLKTPQLEHALKMFQEAVKAEPQDPQHLEKTHTELQQAIATFLQTWEKN